MSLWRPWRRDGAGNEEVFSAEKTSVLHKDISFVYSFYGFISFFIYKGLSMFENE